jgi:hypothetical protein
VLAHATDFKMINVGGRGTGPGDYAAERWVLRRGSAPAGRLNDQCAINFSQAPSHPAALCAFAFTLSGRDEITADGSVVFAPAPEGFRPVPFDLPVTGGTGRYQNACGQIHVKFLGFAFLPGHLGVQGIQPLLPQGPIPAQPFINLGERLGAEAVDPPLRLLADLDQPRLP